MTREERHIAVLNRLLENMDVYDSIQPTTERKKAIKAAIKALENHDTFMKYAYSQGKHDALSQEPCSVLDEIQAEIYETFMTIDGGVHDKSALKCMEIIDKYKASEEIGERNMKMWEEIFKAESEDKK